MSLLATVDPAAATGRVAEIYAEIAAVFGRIPNGLRFFSASPALLERQWREIRRMLEHPSLSGALLASIRLRVAADFSCPYCVGLNRHLLLGVLGWTEEQVLALFTNVDRTPLAEREQALLAFVVKAVKTPEEVAYAEVEALHALGWSDAEVLDATDHGAHSAATDTLFYAFQIEPD